MAQEGLDETDKKGFDGYGDYKHLFDSEDSWEPKVTPGKDVENEG